MDHLQQLHDGGSVVGDGDALTGMDKLVASPRPKCALDYISHSATSVDIGNQLGRPLTGIGALFEEDDRRVKHRGLFDEIELLFSR